jgi:hypothetical protein
MTDGVDCAEAADDTFLSYRDGRDKGVRPRVCEEVSTTITRFGGCAPP